MTSKDLHLGVLPFQPSVTAAAAALSTGTSIPATPGAPGASLLGGSAEPISQGGLDWKLPVIVLVLFVAAAATVAQPAVVDILQLRPLPPPAPLAAEVEKPGKAGASNGGAAGTVAGRAAVAAAAAVPVPEVDSSSQWASDAEQRSLGVKGKGPSMRSRAARRA